GLIWWRLLDQVDWDGALTHRIGKVHEVGLINLKRQPDGTLARASTPLVRLFRELVSSGEEKVGKLESINYPSPEAEDEQLPPIDEWIQPTAPLSTATGTVGDGGGAASAAGSSVESRQN